MISIQPSGSTGMFIDGHSFVITTELSDEHVQRVRGRMCPRVRDLGIDEVLQSGTRHQNIGKTLNLLWFRHHRMVLLREIIPDHATMEVHVLVSYLQEGWTPLLINKLQYRELTLCALNH